MRISTYVIMLSVVFGLMSCAPVKFTRSNAITVNPNVTPQSAVNCTPKINDKLDSFTYSGGENLPSINSLCDTKDLTYEWIVKKADATVINSAVPGLAAVGVPQNVDFKVLGPGSYYVFLQANDSAQTKSSFVATVPLEFIVPGAPPVNNLVCDPKLNNSFTSVIVGGSDPNPEVRANCNPQAAMYIWTVYKNGLTTKVTIPGLSTELQVPDFKSLGDGEYRVYLYATSQDSSRWQSSAPLVVTVKNSVPPNQGKVDCNPRINGTLTELTLTGASQKPLITANCMPSDLQYNWTVTKAGAVTTIPNLVGANSNPDFVSRGNGTYLIYLSATKDAMTTWSSSKPLTITVDSAGPGGLTIQCSPRLNNQFVTMTILPTGPNPLVTAGCQPTMVNYMWTATRNGMTISVPSLAGGTSTPNLAGLGMGTYLLYLNATANGYNAYVSPMPLEVTVASAVSPTRKVLYTKNIEVTDNKVDILMVFDDSNSMMADNKRLSQKMNEFTTELTHQSIDWQVCATLTRSKDVFGNGVLYWGASEFWLSNLIEPRHILKPSTQDNNSIFIKTIEGIPENVIGSDDERGIKAAHAHAGYSVRSGCYRNDASLSVILISDEDVRSIGGDDSRAVAEFEKGKPLEPEDQPQGYIESIKKQFGHDKRFTFNSIIIKPNDAACMAEQDTEGNKSHYGYKYDELSKATGGYVGSICDADYKSNLNLFKDRIVKSLASVPLECAPVGPIKVTVTPAMGSISAELRLNSNTLVFTPAIPAGRKLELEYECPRN